MLATPTALDKRQLWNVESTPAPTTTCSSMHLASGGVIVFGSHSTTTLSQSVLYKPLCTACPSNDSTSCIQDSHSDPFYASSTPIVYVIAVCTVFAWTLLLILLLSPNNITSFRRVNSSSVWQSPLTRASSSFFNGSRPWLQKVGALLTAISMIVATADLFGIAEDQYARRVANAHQLRQVVIGGYDIRVLRVISDVFLWLAQIQTLIRVFPRHKEKLLIKWIGFFLILLDIIFSILHGFVVESDVYSPAQYADALSALAYLFQLSLNLLYATWIMYYAATKRRYAFYHTNMPNISIIAFVSLFAILAPAGFFVADMIVPDVSGWGDYFRWVSAAASSIAVWEWVERIEKLEREEKKDGILGREIYDGDEMIDDTPPDSHGKGWRSGSQGDSSIGKYGSPFYAIRKLVPHARSTPDTQDAVSTTASRYHQPRIPLKVFQRNRRRHRRDSSPPAQPGPGHANSTASAAPVDRSQAPSADSTIYNIRYQAAPNSTTPTVPAIASVSPPQNPQHLSTHDRATTVTFSTADATLQRPPSRAPSNSRVTKRTALTRPLRLPAHLFRRARKSPPLEIKNAMSLDQAVNAGDAASSLRPASESSAAHSQARSGLRARLSGFSGSDNGRFDGGRRGSMQSTSLTATVIPAPPRGHTWSPQDKRHSPLAAIKSGDTPGTVGDNSTPRPADSSSASEPPSAADSDETRSRRVSRSSPLANAPAHSQTQGGAEIEQTQDDDDDDPHQPSPSTPHQQQEEQQQQQQ